MVLYSSSDEEDDQVMIWMDDDEDDDDNNNNVDSVLDDLHASFQDLAKARRQEKEAAAAAAATRHNNNNNHQNMMHAARESLVAEMTQATLPTRESMETQYTTYEESSVPDDDEEDDDNQNDDEDLLSSVRNQMQELFWRRKAEAILQAVAAAAAKEEDDDMIIYEDEDGEEYEEQIIERWFGRDTLPDDLEGACRKLIPIVYKGEEHDDPETMIRRTPLVELYRYLKQHYDYKKDIRHELTQAEQETVEPTTSSSTTTPQPQTSLKELFAQRAATSIQQPPNTQSPSSPSPSPVFLSPSTHTHTQTHPWHESTSTAIYEEVSESQHNDHTNDDDNEDEDDGNDSEEGFDLVVPIIMGDDNDKHEELSESQEEDDASFVEYVEGEEESSHHHHHHGRLDHASTTEVILVDDSTTSTSTNVPEEEVTEVEIVEQDVVVMGKEGDEIVEEIIVEETIHDDNDDDDIMSTPISPPDPVDTTKGSHSDVATDDTTTKESSFSFANLRSKLEDKSTTNTSNLPPKLEDKSPTTSSPIQANTVKGSSSSTDTAHHHDTTTKESSFSFANLRSKLEDQSTTTTSSPKQAATTVPSSSATTPDKSSKSRTEQEAGMGNGIKGSSSGDTVDHGTTKQSSLSFANLRSKLEDKSATTTSSPKQAATTVPSPSATTPDKSSKSRTEQEAGMGNGIKGSSSGDTADHGTTKQSSFSFANLRSKLEDQSTTTSSPKQAATTVPSSSAATPNEQEFGVGNGVKAQADGNETKETFAFGHLRSSSDGSKQKNIPPTKSKATSISSLQTRWNTPQITKNDTGNDDLHNAALMDSSVPTKKPAKFKASSVGSIQSRWSTNQNHTRQADKESNTRSVDSMGKKKEVSSSAPVSPVPSWKAKLRKVPEIEDGEKSQSIAVETQHLHSKEPSWKTSLKSPTKVAANKVQVTASMAPEIETSEETGSALPKWRTSLKPSRQNLDRKPTAKTNDKAATSSVSSWKSSLKSTQADTNVEATIINQETVPKWPKQVPKSAKPSLKSASTRDSDKGSTTSRNTEKGDKSSVVKQSWKASLKPAVPQAAKSKPSPAAMWRASQSAAGTPSSVPRSNATSKASKVSPSAIWKASRAAAVSDSIKPGESIEQTKVAPKASPAAIWKASRMALQSSSSTDSNDAGPQKPKAIVNESKSASSTQETSTKTTTRKWKISPQGNLGKRYVVPTSTKPMPMPGDKTIREEALPLRSSTKVQTPTPNDQAESFAIPRKPSLVGSTTSSETSPAIRPSWLKSQSTSETTSSLSSRASQVAVSSEAPPPDVTSKWGSSSSKQPPPSSPMKLSSDGNDLRSPSRTSSLSSRASQVAVSSEAPPPDVTSKWGSSSSKQPPPSSPMKLSSDGNDLRSPSRRWQKKSVDLPPEESSASVSVSDVQDTSNDVVPAPFKKWKPPTSSAVKFPIKKTLEDSSTDRSPSSPQRSPLPSSSSNNKIKPWKPTSTVSNDPEDSRKSFPKWNSSRPAVSSLKKVTTPSSDSAKSTVDSTTPAMDSFTASYTVPTTSNKETSMKDSPVVSSSSHPVVRKWKPTVPATDRKKPALATSAATASAPSSSTTETAGGGSRGDDKSTTNNFASLRSKFTPTKKEIQEEIIIQEPPGSKTTTTPKEDEFAFSNLKSKFGGGT